jgi:3-isopropylmalate dehydrogenase
MLLRWSLGESGAADAIEAAVRTALGRGLRTPDLGGTDGTAAMTEAVLAGLAVETAALA